MSLIKEITEKTTIANVVAGIILLAAVYKGELSLLEQLALLSAGFLFGVSKKST